MTRTQPLAIYGPVGKHTRATVDSRLYDIKLAQQRVQVRSNMTRSNRHWMQTLHSATVSPFLSSLATCCLVQHTAARLERALSARWRRGKPERVLAWNLINLRMLLFDHPGSGVLQRSRSNRDSDRTQAINFRDVSCADHSRDFAQTGSLSRRYG